MWLSHCEDNQFWNRSKDETCTRPYTLPALLPFEMNLNSVTHSGTVQNRSVHFLGVCGKAMGGIAAALAREGWHVTGSDEKCYAPMDAYLFDSGIAISSPYAARNIPAQTQSVVVGKRVAQSNTELQAVIARSLPHDSFPHFLHQHFLHRSRNAVIAGGLGKTTTTALLTWILEVCGQRPDYLIGGIARNFAHPARFAGAEITVLEGDEYASCFDDPKPKFLHYQPEVAVITNIVEDHPDIFSGEEDLIGAFSSLVELLPPHGLLVIPDDDARAARAAQKAGCPVQTVGWECDEPGRITPVDSGDDGSHFQLMNLNFFVPLCGRMNVRNAAMAVLAASHFGVSPERSAEALGKFQGVENRQEEHCIGESILLTDKATHPQALQALTDALRQRFPGRRLVSVIQPRATGGRNWVYQKELPAVLALFDAVMLTEPYEHRPQQPQVWEKTPFCLDQLAEALEEGCKVTTRARKLEDIPAALEEILMPGDVVVLTAPEQAHALREAVLQVMERLISTV